MLLKLAVHRTCRAGPILGRACAVQSTAVVAVPLQLGVRSPSRDATGGGKDLPVKLAIMVATRYPAILVLAAAALFTACGEEPEPPPPAIRAVKTITVQPQAAVQVRRISGLIQAVNVTQLAFEVGGNVATVLVKVGDKVSRRLEQLEGSDQRQRQPPAQSPAPRLTTAL